MNLHLQCGRLRAEDDVREPRDVAAAGLQDQDIVAALGIKWIEFIAA